MFVVDSSKALSTSTRMKNLPSTSAVSSTPLPAKRQLTASSATSNIVSTSSVVRTTSNSQVHSHLTEKVNQCS